MFITVITLPEDRLQSVFWKEVIAGYIRCGSFADEFLKGATKDPIHFFCLIKKKVGFWSIKY